MIATTKSGAAACERCHRALKDPVSIAARLGPVCRRKLGVAVPADQGMLPSGLEDRTRESYRNARRGRSWTYHLEDGFVVVADLGTGMSVTNDAERVVQSLAAEVPLKGKRIIYRDTEGRWDELRHQGGRFSHFHALGATSAAEAMVLARAAVITPPPGYEVVDTNAFPGDPLLDGTVELRPTKKGGQP
jgi:hypothetical protein